MNTAERCLMVAAHPNEWADNESCVGVEDDELLDYFEGVRETVA